jgi:L-lactate dehydrogenase complex protein LldE
MLISLFIACYNDALFPETGKAVVTVLERLGHTVEFRAEQTCCGQMHYNTGYAADAVPMMRRMIDVFRGSGPICVPSASCVSMMREHYPAMAAAAKDPALAADVDDLLARVFEFSELRGHDSRRRRGSSGGFSRSRQTIRGVHGPRTLDVVLAG